MAAGQGRGDQALAISCTGIDMCRSSELEVWHLDENNQIKVESHHRASG